MKKVAIIQSNYIPWKGYFDIIASVDEFILYDDMQYTKNDWRNRNQIKTPQGIHWLTVPIKTKGRFGQSIREAEIDGVGWAKNHWTSLARNYCRAAHFGEIAEWLEPLYLDKVPSHLSQLNQSFINGICDYLGITTRISNSSEYVLTEGRSERVANLCLLVGGTEYISGPSAKSYIDEKDFLEKGIKLTWFKYDGYPEYPQMWGEFSHGVSILDLLFNCGKDASRYMRHVNT